MNALEISASRPRSVLYNGLWNLGFTIWSFAATFLFTPYIISKIGTSYYGLLTIVLSVTGIMGILNFGLNEATVRFVSFYYNKLDIDGINRVVRATLFVYIAIGIFGAALLYVLAPSLALIFQLSASERLIAGKLFRIICLGFLFGLFAGSFSAISQALRRFDISSTINIMQNTVYMIGAAVLLWKGSGIEEVVWWGVAATFFSMIANCFMAKKLIPRLALLPWPSLDGLKEVFSYGVFSFLTNILGLIWGEADKIILGSFVSTSSVAYLAVPRQMSFRVSLAVSNLGGGLFPKIAAMEDVQERREVFLTYLWIFLSISVVLFVPLTILFPSFLRLWIDPDFSTKSAWVAQIIAASCIVRGAFIAYDALFKGIGKPQYLTLVFIATAATSLILNLLLIPRYGLNGAGYCYVITTFWGFCAIVYTWRKILSQTEWTPLLRNFFIPLIAGILGGGVSLIVLRDLAIHSWFQWILYACVISGLVVCLIALLDFIMNGSTNIRWFWQRIHSMPAFGWIRGAR